jgi:hypothetical protein
MTSLRFGAEEPLVPPPAPSSPAPLLLLALAEPANRRWLRGSSGLCAYRRAEPGSGGDSLHKAGVAGGRG